MPENQPKTGELMAATVPMAATLGIEFPETTAEHAVVRLPDRLAHHNHVGGPHAGAEIGYRKPAMGPVTATARLGRPAADVVAELDRGERPEFPVIVAVQREDGAVTGETTIVWTLRPNG